MGNTRRPSLAAAVVAAGRLMLHQGQATLGSVWRIIKSYNYISNVLKHSDWQGQRTTDRYHRSTAHGGHINRDNETEREEKMEGIK